ncbi:splicing factor 3B subunit 3-like protein [Tanacetum coccineum]
MERGEDRGKRGEWGARGGEGRECGCGLRGSGVCEEGELSGRVRGEDVMLDEREMGRNDWTGRLWERERREGSERVRGEELGWRGGKKEEGGRKGGVVQRSGRGFGRGWEEGDGGDMGWRVWDGEISDGGTARGIRIDDGRGAERERYRKVDGVGRWEIGEWRSESWEGDVESLKEWEGGECGRREERYVTGCAGGARRGWTSGEESEMLRDRRMRSEEGLGRARGRGRWGEGEEEEGAPRRDGLIDDEGGGEDQGRDEGRRRERGRSGGERTSGSNPIMNITLLLVSMNPQQRTSQFDNNQEQWTKMVQYKETQNEMSVDVACLDIAPVPEGRQRSGFLAVGSYDNTIRIKAKAEEDPLAQIPQEEEGPVLKGPRGQPTTQEKEAVVENLNLAPVQYM